jgi:glycosyltransferase involved in cell wall biosynthesis
VDERLSIAVVIPAYNGAQFIEKAIRSVLEQTRPPDEIIVVDDGSSDGTPDVVRRYPVMLITQARSGVSAARNRAIAEAKSDWIAFLDQDDWYHPQKLEAHEPALRPGVVLSYSSVCVVENGREFQFPLLPPKAVRKQLPYRNPLTPGRVVVRRSVLRDTGGFNVQVHGCEDWELWVRLAKRGQFMPAEKALLYLSVHGENYSLKPRKMLHAAEAALPLLLAGTTGWKRLALKRRIMAAQYSNAAVMCRCQNEMDALAYCLRCVFAWPLPECGVGKYKLLGVQFLRTTRYLLERRSLDCRRKSPAPRQ